MIDAKEIHERMMREDAEYAREYDALEEEFSIAQAMIRARSRAGLTQAEVAKRMGVSQPRVAKIEAGSNVSLDILRRYAAATGSKLKLDFQQSQ
ncbi:MAG: helix-turn-helix transcriptional regulator [Desulfovibrionaceae bacterium]|nr:helix-turn-helix transcriptional regulator [Desulfovibrionaceae bacterium]MBF0513898.1 helix-turn-helix transcriptional regulator [Desulfovibrionaceae bacterium]